MKSKEWLNRHKRDVFVKKAKQKGYLSRAAFKLIEIENKFKILRSAKNVFESRDKFLFIVQVCLISYV